MPPTLCAQCNSSRALIIRPKNRQKLCKECFFEIFETEIHNTITNNSLFHKGERIAVGASGGKDSTVLASVLKTLNERYSYGLDITLLSIDEGIKDYRDDSLETVKRNAVQYDMPLVIVGYDQLYGWTMDQIVAQIGKKNNCTYCGVFRRQALDRGAAQLKIQHVVTGHNADDVAETVMMNLLRGDLPRLSRATSIVTASAASEIKRSKPLKYTYEKEIVLYAHHKGLDYFSTECIYSPEAFRGSARTLIKNLERVRPSAILDIVRSGEDMAKLVPLDVTGGSKKKEIRESRVSVVEGEDEGVGSCGKTNDGTSMSEMAKMEASLRENDVAQDRETEITLPPSNNLKLQKSTPQESIKLPMRGKRARKLPMQEMGKCSRCGYLSSQEICKACMLLEGLNKGRPQVDIQIGADQEDHLHTLRRNLEGLKVG
ncbi:MAG: nucleotidyltransferase [Icmadophila ericetorum]|nr:nucleotidyltransferase [Icmadophila ericetorum]